MSGEYSTKNWGATPMVTDPTETSAFIESTIKEFYDRCIAPDDPLARLKAYNTKRDCEIAFVRHLANLINKGESDERIQQDIQHIWSTYFVYAKKIEVHGSPPDSYTDGYPGSDAINCLAVSASAVRNAKLDIIFDDLEPVKDGIVAHADKDLAELSEEEQKKERETHPWWDLNVDAMRKAADALYSAAPDDFIAYMRDGPFPDDGRNGWLHDHFAKLLDTLPDPSSEKEVKEWWSINAFISAIVGSDSSDSQYGKIGTWPLNTAVKMISCALEEDRPFASSVPTAPTIGVLAGVVPIWLSAQGYALLLEANKKKGIDVANRKMSVEPGTLGQKQGFPPYMTSKRWAFWKSQCDSISDLAKGTQATTAKAKESKLKFWKKGDKAGNSSEPSSGGPGDSFSRKTCINTLPLARKIMEEEAKKFDALR